VLHCRRAKSRSVGAARARSAVPGRRKAVGRLLLDGGDALIVVLRARPRKELSVLSLVPLLPTPGRAWTQKWAHSDVPWQDETTLVSAPAWCSALPAGMQRAARARLAGALEVAQVGVRVGDGAQQVDGRLVRQPRAQRLAALQRRERRVGVPALRAGAMLGPITHM
jgi:hypothetical protein